MSQQVLVTYASHGGSTAEIARAVAEVLSQRGLQPDVRPVTEVHDLSPYGAVVLGSAINASEWLPEAMAFAREHQAELNRKPFADFIVCMTMSMKPAMIRSSAKKFLEPMHTLIANPVSEGCFAGVVRFDQMVPENVQRSMWFRTMTKLGLFTEGDHRDWDAIRAWAHDLSGKLPPVR